MPSILKRLASRIGAKVIFEPEYKIVGLIRFPNGRKSFFWHNKFNLNSVSSARIAQDKGYTCFFLKKLGYKVPKTKTFFQRDFAGHLGSSRNFEEALEFSKALGWPVFVKPCHRSQGESVFPVFNKKEFVYAANKVFSCDRVMLVQEACKGRDYRIVVLDGEVISAYERVPLSVEGDGHRTIGQLLQLLQKRFDKCGRDTVIPRKDPRILMHLSQSGLSLISIPRRGERVQLLGVANLSLGGMTVEITKQIHPSVSRLAAKIADGMDLRLAGVDLICDDATKPLTNYSILEVNSAPGLDHYGSFGRKHDLQIDRLYLKVLKAIERGAK